jgi:dsDNA-specific endonuclease/ATPase MutS2
MRLLKRLFGRGQKPAVDDKEPDAGPFEPELDPYEPFPEPVEIEISDVFDLHSFAPRDVKRVVEEYLTQAHAAGFSRVRLIHGKGVGVQREMVRTILARTAFVIDFKDAPPEAGGWGATVARLKVER